VGEVVGLLVDAEVPVAPVLSIDETVQDPHVLARGMMVEVEHPQAGRIKMPNFPVKFSEMRGEIRSPAPLLGQHTDEILSKLLNYSQDDIKKLKTQRVL
jgi:CoA:oxalate CoA-transferase